MSDTYPRDKPHPGARSPRLVRWIAAVIAIVPLTALSVARWLEPNSSGMGTHEQLGLPPCSMKLLFGIPCPGCGMTTSWAHFTRGNWSQSIQASGGGFLLAVFAIWVALLGIRSSITARPPGESMQRWLAISAVAIAAVALLQWVERLMA